MKIATCLLIDDDPDQHELFLLALEKKYDCSKCWTAASCLEAIEKIRSGSFAVPEQIFVDWKLIYMDAQECIGLLGRVKEIQNVPLFIVSGQPPFLSQNAFSAMGVQNIRKKTGSLDMYSAALT